MKESQQHWTRVLPSLLIPIFVGLSLYLVVMTLLETGQISNEVVQRYLTGHPVSKITTAMFCVGLASLGLMALDVVGQALAMGRISAAFQSGHCEPRPDGSSAEGPADALSSRGSEPTTTGPPASDILERLKQDCRSQQHHHLYQRLVRLLTYVARGDEAGTWDDEAKYLSDLDQEKMGHRYSLVRILIWATPMLGFLGTVLGISQALGGIQVGPDNDFQQMMDGLRGSLYVAFDTTALALTLSMVLMFFQFLVERFETQLLTVVDERAVALMSERFGRKSQTPTNHALQQIQRTVAASNHQLVQHQAELWRETILAAQEAWKSSLVDSNEAVQEGLRAAVVHAVRELQQQIGRNIDRADNALTRRWEQWQVLLSENARKFSLNQSEMIRQTEVLADAIGSLRDIQQRLNAVQRPEQTLQATERLQQTLDRLVKTIEWMARQPVARPAATEKKPASVKPLENARPGEIDDQIRVRDAFFDQPSDSAVRQKKAG